MSSAVAPAPTGLYEPLSSRPFEITASQRGGYAFFTAIIGIVLAGLTVGVKLQSALSTFRKLRIDDVALVAGTVLAVGYSVAVCRAVQHGLGTAGENISSEQLRLSSQHYYASNMLLFLSLACTKCALALLIIAIQPVRWIMTCSYSVLAVSVIWGIAAVLVVALQCGPIHWTMGPTADVQCIDQYTAHAALRSVDILLDVALAVLPALMVLGVQISPAKRLVVASIFGMRIMTAVFTVIAVTTMRDLYNASTIDRPYVSVTTTIWNIVVINVSLITACLPSIKRFLTDWAAGVANAQLEDTFELQSMSAHRSGKSQHSGADLRSFGRSGGHSVGVSTGERRSSKLDHGPRVRSRRDPGEDDSDSEKRLFDGISRTVEIEIEYNQSKRT